MENLIKIAKEYRDKYNFSVIPVILRYRDESNEKIDKKPAIPWSVFIERFPTDEEIQSGFNKPGVNAIGLITGKISGITVLDWDGKYDECPYESPVMVRTISGGKHIYFKYKEGIRNTVRVGGRELDVRGEGGFVVIPPSLFDEHTYSWKIEGDLKNLLKKLPEFPSLNKETPLENFVKPLNISECINVKKGSRDDKLYKLACSLLQRLPIDQCLELLLATAKTYEGYGDTFTEKDVREKCKSAYDFLNKKGKTFDQKNQKESKKTNERNIIYTSFFETDDFILEEIKYPIKNTNNKNLTNLFTTGQEKFCFIKFNKQNKNLEIVDEEKIGEKTVKPIVDELVQKGVINIPRIFVLPDKNEFAKCAEFAPLVLDIQNFFDKFFDVSEFNRKFLPYYVLFTWVYERFDFVPYVQFCGLTGTGKTRSAETVTVICYKSIDVRGSATIAAIFRTADLWKGTLFIDEFDMASFGRENYAAALAFLKAGVGDGSVIRVEGLGKRVVTAYSVKCPRIFTSEKPINDAGLQSRTYVIEMEQSTRKLPLFKIKDKYETEINNLRTRLLYWRLLNFNKIDLSKIEYGFPELSCFDKRVQQVITPIYYLADKESRSSLLKFAQEQEKNTYIERREAIAGIVFEIIKEIKESNDNEDQDSFNFSNIRDKVQEKIGNNSNDNISPQVLSKVIKTELHFETKKFGSKHITKVVFTDDKFEAMLRYYGYKEKKDAF